jgi:hypothetical protein
MTSEALKSQSRKDLASLAKRRGITRWHSMTKAELVRALLRMAAAKRRSAALLQRSRRPSLSARTGGKNGRSSRKNGIANGHVLPVRARDLCTTEVDDRYISGRKNYIDVKDCDANWICAQWDLTRDSVRRAESRLGTAWHTAVPALRLFEVSVDDVNSVAEIKVKDVLIEAGVNTWYVHVPSEGRSYRLHIGYRTQQGNFFALAKSNVCAMPALNAKVTPPRNGHHAGNGHATGARSENGDSKPDGRLGRPLGFSSLSHFGPGAMEEREKGEFNFKLDTELVVHGSTRPGSMLTVQGDPVELRDDGSFTIRVNQPEGRQVVAFTALSPRGSERRMIVLGVERNTKELERQYFDGGHPDGHGD